ncbi:glycosyltransferase family 4 protein [Alicyclobacillus sp. ALC3]|uniref:glycosyltransferase family 4 protein n=1 Tax=Alicyclobacillus sp. ALC3 TaxID=2796143 RepID=UPI002379C872|nr:glycosyltransferase family 1 protein [Alicyclobacillus sp. ALC3]WDL95154.1 glycosyltransferase family 4 protein [Alicyclobacillus sp. ALC3]
MRLLVWCSSASLGGGTKLFNGLVSALAKDANIEFMRVVLNCPPEMRRDIRIERNLNVEIVELPQGDNSTGLEQARLLAQDCHVVYFFWPHQREWMDLRRPTVCTFHDTTLFDYVPPFAVGSHISAEYKRAVRWMSNSTMVVAPSIHVASRIQTHFDVVRDHITVIPHVLMPAPTSSGSILHERLSEIPEKYILYPANTSPHKNHANLFLAYQRFAAHNEYPLVLTGFLTDTLRKAPPEWSEIAYIPWLQSVIRDAGLRIDRQLYPLGFISHQHMQSLIQFATAVIMPSISEGGGSYPVEEALQSGTPVLCSDIPVLREQMASHTAKVIWFDPWSPDSIARALEELIRGYAGYKRSAIEGTSNPKMSWEKLAQKYSSTFSEAYLRYRRSLS